VTIAACPFLPTAEVILHANEAAVPHHTTTLCLDPFAQLM
jgi:hypothetical protein